MSEDISDGTPSEEKPEVMEMPSNEVLPHESVPQLAEAEISHESSQDQHGQVTQNVSNREEGDVLINENPLTEKLVESLPCNLPSSEETTEDVPTECIETVSLDTEPELEETLHEQSNPEFPVLLLNYTCEETLEEKPSTLAPASNSGRKETGHGITAVKEKAGTTLRIHSASSASLETAEPPAAETPVTQAEDSLDQSSSENIPSSPSSGSRGMLSAITSAVQNTLLREAKEKEKQRRAQQVTVERTAHYGLLFDEFQGLSHLEALEILSNESEAQIQSHLATLDGEQLETVKNDLIAIKEIFVPKELDDEVVQEQKADMGEEFVSMLTELLFELHVAATPDKLNKARKKAHEWLEEASLSTPVSIEEELNEKPEAPGEENTQKDNKIESDKTEVDKSKTVEEIYMLSIESLAEITARCIEQLHKVAELILHGQEVEKPAQDQAKVLTNLTSAMCNEVSSLSKKFSDSVTAAGSNMKAEVLNPIINSVLLEGNFSVAADLPSCTPGTTKSRNI
ncbi:Protein Noxp20 [Turdus rufiventris]|nr:Protein Noxp20 [Turdus rufiventris]